MVAQLAVGLKPKSLKIKEERIRENHIHLEGVQTDF
jgi:hypothetical protein